MVQVYTANSDNNHHQSNKATCFQGHLPTDSIPVLCPCQTEDFLYRLEPKSKKVRDMGLESQCLSCGVSYGTGKLCTGGLIIHFIRFGILLRNGLLSKSRLQEEGTRQFHPASRSSSTSSNIRFRVWTIKFSCTLVTCSFTALEIVLTVVPK